MVYLVTSQQELFKFEEYTIISVEESLAMLNSCEILQYDSETTGRDARICDLLCAQFGNKEKDFQIVIDCTTVSILRYKDILESKLLVGQNLKFDLQFLYNYGIIPRKVYDTMIVEQLLYLGFPYISIYPERYEEFNYDFPYNIAIEKNTGKELYELSFSLAAIAKKRLKIDIDKSIRGQIIWRGLDVQVILYAANDVKWLEDIMWSQVADCRKKNCLIGAKLECDFVPVIAYLEWCGIKLDEDRWGKKMDKDRKSLDSAKAELDNFVIDNPLLKKFTHIDLQGDLFKGFSSGPTCDINWSSSKQVIEVAKILGFNTTTQDKKTKEDKDSVLEKHLKGQKGINDKFLDLYFDYQEHAKVVSTYGQGHLNAVNPNTGRIHTTYKQLGAASGRMSCGSKQANEDLARLKKIGSTKCSYPNMQQLPADEDTRSSFVCDEGNLFVSCDYAALESRLGADIYNEPAMINEYLYGSGDMHSLVAKACFPEELEGVEVKDIKKLRPDLRKKAKGPEFAMQFGGSSIAIAQALGCSIEEADKIADAYWKGFPGIAKFKAKGSRAVRKNGYVLMCKYTGHKMYWWDHNEWLARQSKFTTEFWDDYRNNHKGTGSAVALEVREHFQAASKWDRMALNSVTQGTGSICLKDSMITLFDWIIDNGLFNKVKIVALVHDEACIEYPNTIVDFPKLLEETMEKSAAKYCKSLPIPAEASVGNHWIH